MLYVSEQVNRVQCGRGSSTRSKRSQRKSLRRLVVVCVMIATVGLVLSDSRSAGSEPASVLQEEVAASRHIVVTVNKSRTFRLSRPFAQAVVGAPDIADALLMSDRTIYIQGKKVGTTNVSIFDQGMRLVGVVDVEVATDTRNLAEKISASTDSRGIHVTANNGQVILSGEARDAVAADRAVSIARGMMPDSAVVNAMSVAASQQVMLKVRFLEVSRSAERDLGVNLLGSNASGTKGFNTGLGAPTQAGTTLPAQPGQAPAPTVGSLPLFQTLGTFAGGTTSLPFGVALAQLASKGFSIDALITALETKGVVRSLAEPDLVALSGDTASFLAGGEFPVPSVQPGGTNGVPVITTEYKPFGVQLTFVPTVLAKGVINVRLSPSVSELDFTNAIQISGFLVPSLIKREARTTIELRDGQSFAIAGLLQSDGRRSIAQLPWVGSVPVLGALFRSDSFLATETDLVVIVTPHLVAPAVPGQVLASPLDRKLPGNDVDLFLMGQTEVTKRDTGARADVHGPYGYIMPLPGQTQ
jgi:pilus assembly protein CpaC